jgi:gliding motility-associated lipoprotein GldH
MILRKKNIFLLVFVLGLAACTTVDLYEKNINIPGFSWSSSFKPQFNFTIKDTSADYELFLVLRHNEKYNYNNIWINLYSQPPGDSMHKAPFELTLATNEKGWLGSGTDDVYEHRIPLTPKQHLKAGDYHFSVEQIMRDEPLQNVMSVGLRLEKKP